MYTAARHRRARVYARNEPRPSGDFRGAVMLPEYRRDFRAKGDEAETIFHILGQTMPPTNPGGWAKKGTLNVRLHSADQTARGGAAAADPNGLDQIERLIGAKGEGAPAPAAQAEEQDVARAGAAVWAPAVPAGRRHGETRGVTVPAKSKTTSG